MSSAPSSAPSQLDALNQFAADAAGEAFLRCCGATRWARAMSAARPFVDESALFARAADEFATLSEADWLEAFRAHPKIGDRAALREKFAATAAWAEGEQAGAAAATDAVLDALADGNRVYEQRFGFIFIVCATGKSAAEMLALLQARLPNPRADELAVAAGEQRKITRLRLEKLLSPGARPA